MALTTISQHLPKKAELIVNQLINKIEGTEVQQHMTVDVEIIDYNSVRSLK